MFCYLLGYPWHQLGWAVEKCPALPGSSPFSSLRWWLPSSGHAGERAPNRLRIAKISLLDWGEFIQNPTMIPKNPKNPKKPRKIIGSASFLLRSKPKKKKNHCSFEAARHRVWLLHLHPGGWRLHVQAKRIESMDGCFLPGCSICEW